MAGVIQLTVTSPVQSFTELLETGEVMTYMGLTTPDPPDPFFDQNIATLITAAREQAELFQGRDIVVKQYDLWIDSFDCPEISLIQPLVSVDLVRYRDSDGTYHTLTENTDFVVDLPRGRILPHYGLSWPSFTAWPSSSVIVRFTAGAGVVPAIVKVGMLTLISDWFNNRLPFGTGIDAANGYPVRLTQLLSYGARERVF